MEDVNSLDATKIGKKIRIENSVSCLQGLIP